MSFKKQIKKQKSILLVPRALNVLLQMNVTFSVKYER